MHCDLPSARQQRTCCFGLRRVVGVGSPERNRVCSRDRRPDPQHDVSPNRCGWLQSQIGEGDAKVLSSGACGKHGDRIGRRTPDGSRARSRTVLSNRDNLSSRCPFSRLVRLNQLLHCWIALWCTRVLQSGLDSDQLFCCRKDWRSIDYCANIGRLIQDLRKNLALVRLTFHRRELNRCHPWIG